MNQNPDIAARRIKSMLDTSSKHRDPTPDTFYSYLLFSVQFTTHFLLHTSRQSLKLLSSSSIQNYLHLLQTQTTCVSLLLSSLSPSSSPSSLPQSQPQSPKPRLSHYQSQSSHGTRTQTQSPAP